MNEQTTMHTITSDPTHLTNQMVMREVTILDNKMDNAIETRRQDDLAMTKLFIEKFDFIDTRFDLTERQRIEQKKDTKDAVDAALIAQKEAVKEQTIASGLSIAKSETATEKRLEQLTVTMNTAFTSQQQSVSEMKDNFNGSINDLKTNIGKIDAVKIGIAEQQSHTKENVSMSYMLIGIVIGLVSIASLVIAIFK